MSKSKFVFFLFIVSFSMHFTLQAQNSLLQNKYIKNPVNKEFRQKPFEVVDSLNKTLSVTNTIIIHNYDRQLYAVKRQGNWKEYLLVDNYPNLGMFTVDEYGNRDPDILCTLYEFDANYLYQFLVANNK